MTLAAVTVTVDLGPALLGLAAVISAIFSGLAFLSSQRNAKRIDKVEVNTNSISTRNEEIAKKLGIVEGKAAEKADHAQRTADVAAAVKAVTPAIPAAAAAAPVEVVASVPLTIKLDKDDLKP